MQALYQICDWKILYLVIFYKKNAATALIKNATVIIIHCKIVKFHLTVCSDFFLKYSFQVIVLPVLLFGNLIVLDVLIETTHH